MRGNDSFDAKQLLQTIAGGRAILFAGAGFSAECKNIRNEHPPLAKDLALSICRKGVFEENEDLMYASDYFLEKRSKKDLIDILKEYFTIKEVNRSHELIAALDWRRIYTTNYDNAIELAALRSSKSLTPLSSEDNPKVRFRDRDQVVHINGIATMATEEDFDKRIRLTQSSYDSPESFTKSPWYQYFKQELCSAIVFVGYSLYDIDIARILFSKDKIFQRKTYFVTRENPRPNLAWRLQSYGLLLPIGVDGFAKYIAETPVEAPHRESWFDTLYKYEMTESDEDITDSYIMNFILNGEINNGAIDNAITNIQRRPYMIVREISDKIIASLPEAKNVAVLSDFGNGKSILLRQIASKLTIIGKDVFILNSPEGAFGNDIQKLHDLAKEVVIIIDDYASYPDVLLSIFEFNSPHIYTIFADRSNKHEIHSQNLRKTGTKYFEFGINMLADNEISSLISIVDNLGWWPGKVYKPESKIKFLKNDNNSQIASSLLSIFNSPQMRSRIAELVKPLLRTAESRDMVFAICLLEELGLPRTTSLISEVSGNDSVWDAEVRDSQYFQQLFKFTDNKIDSNSSILTRTLLMNFFKPSYITDNLLDLVEKYEPLKETGPIQQHLFLLLVRFSTVERLIPDEGKRNSLIKYYDELKIRVPRQKFNPMYWLQYGMARISHGQLIEAQVLLDEAYKIADRMDGYDTSAIDVQQARIYLKQGIEAFNSKTAWESFDKGHRILASLDNDKFKYRQLNLYLEFFNKKYEMLSSKSKADFVKAVNHTRQSLEKSSRVLKSSLESDSSLWYARQCLDKIPSISPGKENN